MKTHLDCCIKIIRYTNCVYVVHPTPPLTLFHSILFPFNIVKKKKIIANGSSGYFNIQDLLFNKFHLALFPLEFWLLGNLTNNDVNGGVGVVPS